MVFLMGFVPGKRFRRDKMGCGARTLGVATGEEALELRLVMKSAHFPKYVILGIVNSK